MKSLQATDIIPLAILYKIAQHIREVATQIGVSKNVPQMDARRIGIPTPKVTQGQIEIYLTLNQLHSAYEWGSGIHRTRGTPAKYLIAPKEGKYLAFYENERGIWDYSKGMPKLHMLEPDGRGLFESVMHPGVKARPFLEPAKKQTRQENLQIIRENATKNIRLIMVGMSRKI